VNNIYLDNNATTEPLSEVVETVRLALTNNWKNPSSPYLSAQDARMILQSTREAIGSFIQTDPEYVHFVSSGSEANQLSASSAIALAPKGKNRIIVSAIEHASILHWVENLSDKWEVTVIPPNSKGQTSFNDLSKAITEDVALVIMQWVNNETGVIQPVEEISGIATAMGAFFLVDAAQAIGKIPVLANDIDYLTFTGHKIHAPKGTGVVVTPHRSTPPFSTHEDGWLSGTEPVCLIAGLREAVQQRSQSFEEAVDVMRSIRDEFENLLLKAGMMVNGDTDQRVCNTSNIRFPSVDARALMTRLDLNGLQCSQSSACMSARPEPSHVLTAMGLSEEEAYASLRFSFSVLNTLEDARAGAELVIREYRAIKSFSLEVA